MFHSLLVFWLIVADPFLVTLISASLWELFASFVVIHTGRLYLLLILTA